MANAKTILTLGLAMLIGLLAGGAALAAGGNGKTYSVTITNLTKKQVFTPPLVISHNSDFKLFMLGQPASDGLVALAEGGNTQPLEAMLGTRDEVFDYMAGAGGIPPGESRTIEIKVKGQYRKLSLAGMLATSNDAFVAINGITIRHFGEQSLTAVAYDAGSEFNTELCSDVPGPPCAEASGNARVPTDGTDTEGFVHVHNGIHGVGDLSEANMDWHNPVARVVIKKMKN